MRKEDGGGENCAPQHHHDKFHRTAAQEWNAKLRKHPCATHCCFRLRQTKKRGGGGGQRWRLERDERRMPRHTPHMKPLLSKSKRKLITDGRWWITDEALHWQRNPEFILWWFAEKVVEAMHLMWTAKHVLCQSSLNSSLRHCSSTGFLSNQLAGTPPVWIPEHREKRKKDKQGCRPGG